MTHTQKRELIFGLQAVERLHDETQSMIARPRGDRDLMLKVVDNMCMGLIIAIKRYLGVPTEVETGDVPVAMGSEA